MSVSFTTALLLAASLPTVALAHEGEVHLPWWQDTLIAVVPYVLLGLILLGLLTLLASLFFGARWLYRRLKKRYSGSLREKYGHRME
jgi:hypothetical protein